MKKALFSLALLCASSVTLQADETQATVVCQHPEIVCQHSEAVCRHKDPEVTREHFDNAINALSNRFDVLEQKDPEIQKEHFNNTMGAVTSKLEALGKKDPEIQKEHFDNTMNMVTSKLEALGKKDTTKGVSAKDLNALEKRVLDAIAAQKKDPKHPCTSYSDGSASWGARMTMDYAKVVAANAYSTDTSFLTQVALAFYPLWHNVVHTETKALNNDELWKFLPSNWTDLSIASFIYLVSKKHTEWTKAQILEYVIAAIYAKGALAIAVEKLGLVENQEEVN